MFSINRTINNQRRTKLFSSKFSSMIYLLSNERFLVDWTRANDTNDELFLRRFCSIDVLFLKQISSFDCQVKDLMIKDQVVQESISTLHFSSQQKMMFAHAIDHHTTDRYFQTSFGVELIQTSKQMLSNGWKKQSSSKMWINLIRTSLIYSLSLSKQGFFEINNRKWH